MADEKLILDGGHNPVVIAKDGSSLLAPGLKAKVTTLTGEEESYYEAFTSVYGNLKNEAFFKVLEETHCQVRKTISLDISEEVNIDASGRPPKFIRFRSAAQAGAGSFIRVVHERGHVTWHLPLNKPWRGAATPEFAAGAWEYDIPHVTPSGEDDQGYFGFIGRKVITEVSFFFLKHPGDLHLLHIARSIRARNGLGLKQIDVKNPTAPLTKLTVQSLPMYESRKRTRALVLIHGTFSSTSICFKDLFASKTFAGIARKYDCVLGFDHDTLTVSPETNAKELSDILLPWRQRRKHGIDIVSHSRGGLVGRCLSECKLPERIAWFSRMRSPIERLVMFGTPNSGTPIAQNAMNYINMASHGIGLLPDSDLSTFLFMIISTLKLLAHGVEQLPGIRAQAPGSVFLKTLNRPYFDRSTRYSVASADYIPTNYLIRLLNSLHTHALFNGDQNDLVVPCVSVSACAPAQSFSLNCRYTGDKIHHCNFFKSPRARAFLKEALV